MDLVKFISEMPNGTAIEFFVENGRVTITSKKDSGNGMPVARSSIVRSMKDFDYCSAETAEQRIERDMQVSFYGLFRGAV